MPKPQRGPVLRQIDLLFNEGTFTGYSDAQLLERFATNRDQAAFEALVHRHGPMVLAVCRGVLKCPHDSQDAFQATFLVLVRRARSLWVINGSLESWLYRVAYRIAIKSNADATRRRLIEKQATKMENASADESPEEVLIPALHEEINHLPEKYRAPIVLCHLERLTHAEAARQLDWTEGMVRGRVARGRELLGKRLTRRGLTLSGAGLVSLLSRQTASAAVPKMWIDTTIAAAVAIASGRTGAVALTAGLFRMLLLARLWTGPALATSIVLGVGAGLAGARWLAPGDDIDARGLALASQFKPIELRPMAKPAPPQDQSPYVDPRYVPADGYSWLAFNNNLLSLRFREERWGLPIGPPYVTSNLPASLLKERWGSPLPRDLTIMGSYYIDEAENGDLIITIGHTAEPDSLRVLDCRPVLFDKKGRRYVPLFERSIRCTSPIDSGTAIDRFRLARGILPLDAIGGAGVERLKPEGFQLARQKKPDPRIRMDDPTLRSAATSRFEPASGRSRTILPRPISDGDWSASMSGNHGAVACDVMKTRKGTLVVHICYRSQTRVRNHGDAPEYRPAFFDNHGRRSPHEHDWFNHIREFYDDGLNDSSDMAHFRFEVPAVPNQDSRLIAAQVAYIGVERLNATALREAHIETCLNWMTSRHPCLKNVEHSQLVHEWASGPSSYITIQYGLREILRSYQGEPLNTPRALRDYRIATFRKHMEEEERRWGPRFAARADQPSYIAYQILLNPSAAHGKKRVSQPVHEHVADVRLGPTSTLSGLWVLPP